MAISLDPERLKRYKDIAALLLRHGKKDMMNTTKLDEAAIQDEQQGDKPLEGDPERFARDLESLGPTFIKLGQLLSTRPDFLPMPYIEALTRLQDNVEPFSYEEIETIVQDELGVRLSKAFQEFESTPMAAASLGQVHRAVMRNGRAVAVKVQRPGIRQTIIKDLEALEEIADTLDKYTEAGRQYAFKDMLKQFRATILAELDYTQEAQNLIKLKNNLEHYDTIVIPMPVNDYSTSKVLTMDYVEGTKITKLSPLARIGLNGKRLGQDLFKAYLDQVLVDGFFHADPHPGNVFLTDDNKIALIDLGMVARVDPEGRENLLKLLLYISEGRGIEATKLSIKMGTKLPNFNEANLLRDGSDFVTRYQDITIGQVQVGRVVVELTRIAADNGVRLPPELTMLGKTLLNLDEIGRTLDPEFNPNEVIREHADSIFKKHVYSKFSPGNMFSTLLEMNEFIQKLPSRLNNAFDAISNNDVEIKIRAFEEQRLMENLQKIANRITLGLILAALIIGAALMMRVNSTFTILGYPGLAMLMFVAAAAFGFTLVIDIFMKDQWSKKKG